MTRVGECERRCPLVASSCLSLRLTSRSPSPPSSFIEQTLAILSRPAATPAHDLGLAEHPLIRHSTPSRICVGRLMTVDWQPVNLPQAKDLRPDLETKPPASLVRRVRDVFRARLDPPGIANDIAASTATAPVTDVHRDGGHAEVYRVVYVSRESAKDRKVVNEAELIESLRRELDIASRSEVI